MRRSLSSITGTAALLLLISSFANASTLGWWRMGDSDISPAPVDGVTIATTINEPVGTANDLTFSLGNPAYSTETPSGFIHDPLTMTNHANDWSMFVDGSAAGSGQRPRLFANGITVPAVGFTYETFVRFGAPSNGVDFAYHTSSTTGGWRMERASDSTIRLLMTTPSSGTGATVIDMNSTTVTDLNRWYHVAVVFDGNSQDGSDDVHLFIDHVEETSANMSDTDLTFGGTTPTFYVGNVLNDNFVVGVDESRYLDQALNLDGSEFLDARSFLSLSVDRTTGGISLNNSADNPNSLDILGYSITSDFGSLDQAGWKPIAGNYDDSLSGDGSVDPDDEWTILSANGSHTDLSETLLGGTPGDGGSIAAGASVNLSQGSGAWVRSPLEDLRATVLHANGDIETVPVIFEGNGGNSLTRSDLNFDGAIDALDWAIYRANYNANLSAFSLPMGYALGDLNFDGANNHADFLLFQSDFDEENGAGAFAALSKVPEPTGLALLGAGLIGLLARVNRNGRNRLHSHSHERTCEGSVNCHTGSQTQQTLCRKPNQRLSPEKHLMTLTRKLFLIGAIAICVCSGSVNATPLPLTNAGFESPALADGTASVIGDIPGWVQVGDGDNGATAGSGPYNPKDGQFAGTTGDANPLPSPGGGNQVALINGQTANFSGLGQGVGPLSANTIYTFTGALGNRLDIASRPWPLMNMYIIADNPDPTLGNILATLDVSNAGVLPAGGEFELNSVSLNSASFPGKVGDDLYITITSANDPNESATENQSEWDSIVLNAFEPPSLRVNTQTGVVSLWKQSADDVTTNFYEIRSPTGSLNPTAWASLQDQDLAQLPAGDGSGNGWEELGVPDTNLLGEAFLTSSSTLTGTQKISLGMAFDVTKNQDLTLDISLPGLFTGLQPMAVEYITGLGDMNGDGEVNDLDVNPFVQALTDRTSYEATYQGLDADILGDFNSNGKLDLGDLAGFKAASAATSSGTALASVPEPSAVVLSLFATLLFAGRFKSPNRAALRRNPREPQTEALAQ